MECNSLSHVNDVTNIAFAVDKDGNFHDIHSEK